MNDFKTWLEQNKDLLAAIVALGAIAAIVVNFAKAISKFFHACWTWIRQYSRPTSPPSMPTPSDSSSSLKSKPITIPLLGPDSSAADRLFVRLLTERLLITYARAYKELVGPIDKYLPSHTQQVLNLVAQCELRATIEQIRLGLDALIVLKETKIPSNGFFEANPQMTPDSWAEVFGEWVLLDDMDSLHAAMIARGYEIGEKEIKVWKTKEKRTPVAITLNGRGLSSRVLLPDGRDTKVKDAELSPLPR